MRGLRSMAAGRALSSSAFGIWVSAVACATPPPGAAHPVAGASEATAAAPEPSREVDPSEGMVVAPPERHSDPPRAIEPPAVPAALQAPIELTVELETKVQRPGGTSTRRENVARSAGRVNIRLDDGQVEWLFVQNPVDPRRVSAQLVDHRQREIIEYDESELRMNGIARGWADVAGFGIGPDVIARLEPTGQSERRFGFDFVELRPPAGAAGNAVWWSQEAALPLRVSGASAALSRDVRSVERGVDPTRFVEPRQRFANYGVIAVADYREKHHDAPASNTGAGQGGAPSAPHGHSHP